MVILSRVSFELSGPQSQHVSPWKFQTPSREFSPGAATDQSSINLNAMFKLWSFKLRSFLNDSGVDPSRKFYIFWSLRRSSDGNTLRRAYRSHHLHNVLFPRRGGFPFCNVLKLLARDKLEFSVILIFLPTHTLMHTKLTFQKREKIWKILVRLAVLKRFFFVFSFFCFFCMSWKR